MEGSELLHNSSMVTPKWGNLNARRGPHLDRGTSPTKRRVGQQGKEEVDNPDGKSNFVCVYLFLFSYIILRGVYDFKWGNAYKCTKNLGYHHLDLYEHYMTKYGYETGN